MSITASSESSVHDFDFWTGTWQGRNRRLRERLAGCDEWDEFEGTCVARPLLDGLGNMDEFRTDCQGGFVGLSLRFFDPATRLSSIYWTDTRRSGLLEPPVVGSFSGGIGVFECDDTFEGRPNRRASSVVQRDRLERAVGAVVLGRRRRDLGDELDSGPQPRLSRPFAVLPAEKRCSAWSSSRLLSWRFRRPRTRALVPSS